jgi:hypothetical protein
MSTTKGVSLFHMAISLFQLLLARTKLPSSCKMKAKGKSRKSDQASEKGDVLCEMRFYVPNNEKDMIEEEKKKEEMKKSKVRQLKLTII